MFICGNVLIYIFYLLQVFTNNGSPTIHDAVYQSQFDLNFDLTNFVTNFDPNSCNPISIPIPVTKLRSQFLPSISIPANIHLYSLNLTYILRNPLTVLESRTTSYICLLRNSQQNKCADKIYITGICMRNPLKFCLWNPLTFWNIF